MVDIHAHILPGLDDGSVNMEMSLEMARQAVLSGTKHLVASSHGNFYHYRLQDYWDAFDALQRKLRQEEIPLKLYTGQEIFLNEKALRLLDTEELFTLNHSRYVLVEFDFEEHAERMFYLLQKVRERHLIPVIAHPERYQELQADPEILWDMKEKGYLFQSNCGSLLGEYGKEAQRASIRFLRDGLIHVLATDAHDSLRRTTKTEKVLQWLQERYSPASIRLWTSENPSRILKDMPVLSRK